MAFDLRNEQGHLDRSKVITEINRAMHSPSLRINTDVTIIFLTNLMDEVQEAAYQDGYDDANLGRVRQ